MDSRYPSTTAGAVYQPVPIFTSTLDVGNTTDTSEIQLTNNLDDDENDTSNLFHKSIISPMEFEQETESLNSNKENTFEDDELLQQQFSTSNMSHHQDWSTLCFVILSICCTTPVVLGTSHEFFQLFGVYFVYLPFTIHLVILLNTCKMYLSLSQNTAPKSPFGTLNGRYNRKMICKNVTICIVSLVDFTLMGLIYPKYLWTFMIQNLFTEIDGTTSVDWSSYKDSFELYRSIAIATALVRLIVTTISYAMELYVCLHTHREQLQCFVPMFRCMDKRSLSSGTSLGLLRTILQYIISILLFILTIILFVSMSSAMVRFSTSTVAIPQGSTSACDPLDETECWLPFPSFHMLQKDNSTDTGYRVHLQGDLLPPLKRSRLWLFQNKADMYIQPNFLNRLDGFSTMGPILFYIDGLKEAHEAGIMQLKGSNALNESTTNESVTFLINVETKTFIPHTAEIDYLDINNPMVMIFPAQPLYHNQHYAVAVINALDANGIRLPPTNGMNSIHTLLRHREKNRTIDLQFSIYDINRVNRYRHQVIPAVEEASSFWFNYPDDPLSLQLLFDFHTISALSQLGPVRYVRDTTMKVVSSLDWNWSQHIRTNNIINYNCDDYYGENSKQVLARTVHAEIDVPWFLHPNPADTTSERKNKRSSILIDSTRTGEDITNHISLGVAKFVIHIPCSVQATAMNTFENMISQDEPSTATTKLIKPIRAIMEFGHGLFGNRDEASDDYLLKMAQNEGYVLMAMDWRGMSTYDLLLVVKILISKPHQFESVRDNIIQGYGCKYAMQHFARHALLSMDWFKFSISPVDNTLHLVKTYDNDPPANVFYGISQGGILGAGYTALSGNLALIDRSIIGSGGTPFALIMTRSRDFLLYDQLLQINFYKNRHVRMLLALVQMAWDSVEGSGVLAPPVIERNPVTLIQAGLGDGIVSAYSSEVLSRAFNAYLLPNNPQHVFGLPINSGITKKNLSMNVILTELMYDNEFNLISVDNDIGNSIKNAIHVCLRRDAALIHQIVNFVNNANISNPCTQSKDACKRSSIQC